MRKRIALLCLIISFSLTGSGFAFSEDDTDAAADLPEEHEADADLFTEPYEDTEDSFVPEDISAPEDSSAVLEENISAADQSSAARKAAADRPDSGNTVDADGLIEDPGGNAVDESLVFEITDDWAKEEMAKDAALSGPVYGRLYPPAPLLDGINSFRQGDMRWGAHPYGYADAAGTVPATISSSGCGLLSLVNAVYYMTENFIDPSALADWSTSHGFRQNGTGTVHSLYQAFAKAYGEKFGFCYAGTASSLSGIRQFLHEDGAAIISTDHHLMCVADYDAAKGGYLLLDSAPSSWRGTYPTGYRYLSESDFSESIPVYAIMLLKPLPHIKKGREKAPYNTLAGPDEASSAAVSKGEEAFFRYIMNCYIEELPGHFSSAGPEDQELREIPQLQAVLHE